MCLGNGSHLGMPVDPFPSLLTWELGGYYSHTLFSAHHLLLTGPPRRAALPEALAGFDRCLVGCPGVLMINACLLLTAPC